MSSFDKNSNESGVVVRVSKGGLVGEYTKDFPFQFFVAPAASSETNTARLPLVSIGCWRVDETRFAFDSSFVSPAITSELKLLVELRQVKKSVDVKGKIHHAPLSIFGHADPISSDEYNKALSGRRAKVIYALLISGQFPERAACLLEEVASAEKWAGGQHQVMQTITSLPPGTADKSLFRAYMRELCPPELQLAPTDFLAQGANASGKGDFQGCSEFNPLLIFSEQDRQAFELSGDHNERNLANAPNRRVTVLLFRPGSRVVPSKWPCPRAMDGPAGCKKRFWSNGEERRSLRLPIQPRRFQDNHDTFACRFYQSLVSKSPCERLYSRIRIRLLDAFSKPIANAPYQLQLSDRLRQGTADDQGWLEEVVDQLPGSCQVSWGYPEATEDSPNNIGKATRIPLDSIYSLVVRFATEHTSETGAHHDDSLARKLGNLGYSWAPTLRENIMAFQQDHRRPEGVTGSPADVHEIVSQWHDTGGTEQVTVDHSITLYGRFPGEDIA